MGAARRLATVVAGVTVGACQFRPAGPGGGADATALDVADAGHAGDGAAGDAAGGCPAEYVSWSSGRYALRSTPRTHALADADCADDAPGRTHLATYEAAATFDADVDAVEPDEQTILFIGGACTETDCGSRRVWFWSTGPAVDESLWPPGQPNQGTTQHALATQQLAGSWVVNNIEQELEQPYICECDP
jgi:hypothetical protein